MNELTQGEPVWWVEHGLRKREILPLKVWIEVCQEEKVRKVGRHKENLKNAISEDHRIENLKKVEIISLVKGSREILEMNHTTFLGLAVRKPC